MAHGRVPNAVDPLRVFCDGLMREVGGEAQPVRFVLESTTHSRPVQRLLRQAAKLVAPVNGTPCSDPSIRAAKAARMEVASSVAG